MLLSDDQGAQPRLNCVDMSRWGGPLTDDEAREMIASGIQKIIVGTGHPNGAGTWARQQAESWLRNGGQHLDAYIYLYFAGNASEQVNNGLGTLEGLPVRTWWLDAEDVDSPELTVDQRVRFLTECEILLGDRRKGVYSGRWWWIPNMNNEATFGHLPLWNSFYDGDPDTDGLPYGGWWDSEIEQYEGSTYVAGQSVDLNYDKSLDRLGEEEMDPKLLEEILSRITKLEDVLAGGRQGVDYQWNDQGNFMKGLGEVQGDLQGLKEAVEDLQAHRRCGE